MYIYIYLFIYFSIYVVVHVFTIKYICICTTAAVAKRSKNPRKLEVIKAGKARKPIAQEPVRRMPTKYEAELLEPSRPCTIASAPSSILRGVAKQEIPTSHASWLRLGLGNFIGALHTKLLQFVLSFSCCLALFPAFSPALCFPCVHCVGLSALLAYPSASAPPRSKEKSQYIFKYRFAGWKDRNTCLLLHLGATHKGPEF